MPTPRRGESESEFVARCMASAESRRSFPKEDQRLAVCHSVYRRRHRVRKAVQAVEQCCLIAKQDIPEVQAMIRFLAPSLARLLEGKAEEVLGAILARLDALSDGLGAPDVDILVQAGRDRQEVLNSILASLILLVEQGYGAAFTQRFRDRVSEAADSLFNAGGRAIGVALDGPRRGLLHQTAVAELELLIQDSVLRNQEVLRAMFRQFLTAKGARTEMTALEEAALLPREPGEVPRNRDDFVADLTAVLAPQQAGFVALDSWAYRWFVASGFDAANSDGFLAFQAVNNPPRGPDERTTPFCRWVHGRIIPLGRARAQMREHVRAVLEGDREQMIANWPFLDAATARNGNELQFERHFRRSALAPYHFGCRTQVLVVRA